MQNRLPYNLERSSVARRAISGGGVEGLEVVEVGAGLVGLAEADGEPGSPEAGFGVVGGRLYSLAEATGPFSGLVF